jgi:serine/threonine protein phosphatase PrpC
MARLLSAASTRKRDGHAYNEDVAYHNASLGLYAVVDGGSSMAGPSLGKQPLQAAQDVTNMLTDECVKWPLLLATADQHRCLLQRAIAKAHQEILGRSCVAQMAAVRAHAGSSNWAVVTVCHVGSARVYVRRAKSGELAVLTVDNTHAGTSANELISAQAGQVHYSNLSVAASYKESVRFRKIQHFSGSCLGDPLVFNPPRAQTVTLEPGDVVLLTTKGVTHNLATHEIAAILNKHATVPQAAADALVEAAYLRSHDPSHLRAKPGDITALVVRCQP